MTKTLPVFSPGRPLRDIFVPGRNPMRPGGGIRIAAGSGQRLESDWDAIKAAVAAGGVVIVLSAYETDVLHQHLVGPIPCGGQVRFDCAEREAVWQVREQPGQLEIVAAKHLCCGTPFDTSFEYGRHRRNKHRGEDADEAAEA